MGHGHSVARDGRLARAPRVARLTVLAVAATLLVAPVSGSTAGSGAATAPFVSAHRGGAAYAPENTMVAFENAVRLGVDELEADTQLTGDGRLVVIHDDTLERTTDCSGSVAATSLTEIRDCDAAFWFSPGQPTTIPDDRVNHPLRGTDVKVPTATELLDYVVPLGDDGPRLSIEIKDIPGEDNFDAAGTAVAEKLVPLIEERELVDRVVVQSFWPAAIDAVKRMNPDIATQFLTTSSTGQTASQNLTYTIARGHDVVAPNHDAPDVDAALVQAAHEAGKRVVFWTPDTEDDLRAAWAHGPDGLITNFPGCLLALAGRDAPDRLTPAGVGPAPRCKAPASAPTGELPAERPPPDECEALRPSRWAPPAGQPSPDAALRVFAPQFKQHVRHVETYDTFETKMRCLMEEHVVPFLEPGLPSVVVFNEDIGLMTLAIGSRGRVAREQAESPGRAPAGDEAPAAAASALAELNAAYAPQVAEYQRRLGPIDPRKQVFVAATDTMVRAYTRTFSRIARDYGVHVVASNNMAPYEASTDPADVAIFADPDLDDVEEVYVATDQTVTNATSLWAPETVDPDAPPGERNLLFKNHKVPITSLEADFIAIDEGPATGPAARANAAGAEVAGFRLGFATSLPAFRWGYRFGDRPDDLEPCADVRETYMPCMDALGVDVVVQAEANPGRWATYQPGGWQPLEWMESTWRSVAEPTVGFRYNVTSHMVGNLLDITFDGQSAITMRGADAPPRHYVGNTQFDGERDPDAYRVHVGDKREFLALAPWVVADAPRDDLETVAAALAPGSGDELENDYLETSIWADLTTTAPSQDLPSGRETPAVGDADRDLPSTGAPSSVPALALVVLGILGARRHRWSGSIRPEPKEQPS